MYVNCTCSQAALAIKKAELQKVEDDLNALQNSLAAAKQKKLDLETQAGLCDTKIVRANQLLDGLGGERSRWTDFSHQLSDRYEKLTGLTEIYIELLLIYVSYVNTLPNASIR